MARKLYGLRLSLLSALLAGSGWAAGSGLQVAPTSLSLQPKQNADGLWLSNTGGSVIHAQVRVYHWTQTGNEDTLEPSRGLIISPPMLQLNMADRQLVRVLRVGPPPAAGGNEEAFRLSIDELPIDTKGKQGLQFVLHYSLPIFVEPVGGAAPAQLSWSLQPTGDHVALQVSNRGGSHAQLAGLYFTDKSGHRTEINPGLLGYVLPGATMRWLLKPPVTAFAGGGVMEVMVNGAKATENLSLADRPR